MERAFMKGKIGMMEDTNAGVKKETPSTAWWKACCTKKHAASEKLSAPQLGDGPFRMSGISCLDRRALRRRGSDPGRL
jgi:hypothetical protein